MTKSLYVTACASLCTLAVPAFAHHPSGAGNTGSSGPINTISASTLKAGQGSAALSLELIRLRQISNETLGEAAHDAAPAAHHEEAGEHEDGHEHGHAEADGHSPHSLKSIESYNLGLAYGVTNDLTISARLPFVRRTDVREGLHFHDHPELGEHATVIETLGDASGLGDASILAQYRFLNDTASGLEMAALFGVKAPTGKTNDKSSEGEIFEAEFQPGSGSWDGQFGLALTKRTGLWSFDASALYHLITEGTQDTDLGDRLQYGVALSYRLSGGSSEEHLHADGSVHLHDKPAAGFTIDAVLELNGEWHDKQSVAGIDDENSGGHTVYISPGVRLTANQSWSAFASVGIPIVEDMNGLQPDPDWRLVTGMSVAF